MSATSTSALAVLAALLALVFPRIGAAGPPVAASRSRSAAVSAAAAVLRVSPDAAELKGRPDLVERLRDTPRGYFRFVSRPFTHAVCAQWRGAGVRFPDVNLHGDAHLEQYAVTSLGRGLTDFDESARGPSVIDLVRFGVSLELAAHEKHWPGEGRRAFGAFLGGYREALKDPGINSQAPPLVERMRDRFARDHRLALDRADAIIDRAPIVASEVEADLQGYVAEMLADDARLTAGFFKIKKAGRNTLGIGSALDEKYLLRVEGPSNDAGDDQIIESKLVRQLSDAACLRPGQGPERVPLGMAFIAYAPFPFSGLVASRGRTFWLHGWTDDYVELSIDSWLDSAQDMRQIAYDVGIQLGRAHQKELNGNDSRGLKRMVLQATCKNRARIRKTVEELTEATVAAWMAFREATRNDNCAACMASVRDLCGCCRWSSLRSDSTLAAWQLLEMATPLTRSSFRISTPATGWRAG
jgi:Uncharacterized protein conserved in bacteria (DUF2252)